MKSYFGHKRVPDDSPLSDFQAAYALLNPRPWPRATEEQDRQRYIYGFNMFVLLRSTIAAATACVLTVGAALIVTSLWTASGEVVSLLSYWPPNAVLRDRILDHGGDATVHTNLAQLLVATSAAHLVWMVWLAWRIGYEFTRTEYQLDRPAAAIVAPIGALLAWWAVLSAPNSGYAFNGPAFNDPTPLMAVEMSLFIAAAYFLSGGAIFYVATWVRGRLRQKSLQ